MTIGLFAQIGLLAHLFSLLAPALGTQRAGLAMGLATVAAIAGRTIVGWTMPLGADRRLAAGACYAAQLIGSMAFIAAGGTDIPLLLFGILSFGIGFGNANSLPPLIAQREFIAEDAARVVALIVAVSQSAYAFAPVTFSLIRDLVPSGTGTDAGAGIFVAAAIAQALAIGAFLAGRERQADRHLVVEPAGAMQPSQLCEPPVDRGEILAGKAGGDDCWAPS
jgi:hypothetical protein